MKTTKFMTALMLVASLAFVACNNKNTPEDPNQQGTEQGGEQGGETVIPTGSTMTCAEAAQQAEGTSVTVEGYVTFAYDASDKFENLQQSAWLSDDASASKGTVQAYYLDVTEAVKKGDKVRATGTIKFYEKDGEKTVEIVKGKMEIIEKGNGGGNGGNDYAGQGDGTIQTDVTNVTIAEAIEIAKPITTGKSEKFYRVSGTVKEVKTKAEDLAKYGNCDFIITDGTNEITCFRTYNVGNVKFTSSDQAPKKGQTATVVGQLMWYSKGNVAEVAYGYIEELK